MAKSKNFKEWIDEDSMNFVKDKKKDTKRYDKKRSAIQNARRQKNSRRNSYM